MILIVGGRGFVGSAFVRACEAAGLAFAVVDRASYDAFVGTECELLINANGNSRKPLATSAPLEEFDASVRSVRRTLADFRADRYVLLSSCDVYPDCSSPDLTREDQPLDPSTQSPYGFHKWLAEQCVRHAAHRWLIVRMGGFVGPGLWKNAIYDILHGGPLWLDPASALQFMSTDDLARAVLELVQVVPENDVFNVCGTGVVQLAEAVAARGQAIEVRPDSPRVRYEVSTEKARRLVDLPGSRETVLDFVRRWSP